MIEPVTQQRWQQAQEAEIAVVSYDYENSRHSARFIFDCLGIELDQQGKSIAEVGCGPYPATLFCQNVNPLLCEPLWFAELKEATGVNPRIRWYRQPFENAPIVEAEECWLFNCLQHVRDPELVTSKAKEIANVIRFFEPVDYPTCVYHPHTFTEQDFVRWFGDTVKRYRGGSVAGFHESDCAYGTWRKG